MSDQSTPPLVTVEWLHDHLNAPQVRIADVRWYLPTTGKRGHDAYASGHIPGAVFIDLDTSLAAPRGSGPGRHPLPSATAFAAAMRDAGTGNATHVIAYDDSGGSIAARLWWLLRYFGHSRVSVLDGGIPRWTAYGLPLETHVPDVMPQLFTTPGASGPVGAFTGGVVDKTQVAALARHPQAIVLDARAPERYEGRLEPVDARPGHIPGAINAPFARNLRDEPAPRLKSAAELRDGYHRLGVSSEKQVVAYCGSGVTACLDILALHVAGFPQALLYEGSWSDWSADLALPAATGPDPG